MDTDTGHNYSDMTVRMPFKKKNTACDAVTLSYFLYVLKLTVPLTSEPFHGNVQQDIRTAVDMLFLWQSSA